MENFTPITSLAGGMLIGLAAVALLLFMGRVAGISGIIGGVLEPKYGDTLWRLAFLMGLVTGGGFISWFSPVSMDIWVDISIPVIILAGFFVGLGARIGSGCTSGHGVCGIGRLAPRSIAASVVFLSSGMITVFVMNYVFGDVVV